MKWHKLTVRDFTEEEIKEGYNEKYTGMWEGATPREGQEVLVGTKIGEEARLDTFIEVDYGTAFENTDADVMYWAEIPKVEEEEIEATDD
ncbi:MAG: hypothetical protein Q4B23_04585 [Helcococcus sp.]|nr:hypothetical protein [Helcococcus sp.]